jgi:3-oxoacyl-[acyl-carrier-protein] synthase II
MDKKRVVVTGMGVISPLGTGLNRFWESLVEGKSGIDEITCFDTADLPTRIAGEVKDFNPESYIEKKEQKWHWKIQGLTFRQ